MLPKCSMVTGSEFEGGEEVLVDASMDGAEESVLGRCTVVEGYDYALLSEPFTFENVSLVCNIFVQLGADDIMAFKELK